VAIIGLLAGILVTLISPVTQLRRGRDTQRKSDLSRIQSAIEIFRADLSAYPSTLPGCSLSLIGGAPANTYMTQVPCDPLSPPTVYLYSANATSTTYCLRACLEDTSDQGRDSSNNFTPCQGVAIAACPAGKVSYTVQNP